MIGDTGETTLHRRAQDAAVCAADTDDRVLLDRLRAGDDAAFGELFSRHSAAVSRLAVGLAADRAEADDLTAEAFFRVLQAIRRGSGPLDNVRGYLLIVTRRVAWEWSLRRRDVPVSDEELTHRAPSDPDTSGQFTERNLIRRAFTSLPERWRRVLWKMEVEGERPAVVATNFGLSPNATAALARRARQGLRAAYLQAHLADNRGDGGCRSVREKLGAFTAGSTSGVEHRRIRAHLGSCTSCTAMQAELRDVCSGLRAHAAHLAVPATAAAGVAGWQLASSGGSAAASGSVAASGSAGAGWLAGVKGLLASAKVQVALAATSAAAVGALGIIAGQGGSTDDLADGTDMDGRGGTEQAIEHVSTEVTSTVVLDRGTLTTHIAVASAAEPDTGTGRGGEAAERTSAEGGEHVTDRTGPDGTGDSRGEPLTSTPDTFDEEAPVTYRQTTVQRRTERYETYTLVHETTTVTEVNTLEQTRTTTETTKYTEPSTGSHSDPTVHPRSTGRALTSPPALSATSSPTLSSTPSLTSSPALSPTSSPDGF